MDKSVNYTNLMNKLKEYLETCDLTFLSVQKFKKLIQNHLDEPSKNIKLEDASIYLDEIDHRLHPEIQSILTNNFALKQQQYQLFNQISEILFNIHRELPEINQKDIQRYFLDNKIPIYLIPVYNNNSSNSSNYSYIWGNTEKIYPISIVITPNSKYLLEILNKYGYDTIEETFDKLDEAGFTISN